MPDAAGAYRVLLCDKWGRPLSNLTTIATDRKLVETANSPSSFTFAVDSSHPKVRNLHTDGAPLLDYIRRVIKVYRRELVAGDLHYVLRHAGYVWPVEDSGDEESQETRVTSLDPLIVMNSRFARSDAGSFVSVPFTATPAGAAWQTLIDRTNTIAGPSGLVIDSAILELTDPITVEWTYKMIGEVTAELTKGMDIWVEPIDSRSVIAHGRANVYAKRGTVKPNVLLSYDAAKHNVAQVTRTMDPTDACTTLVGLGTTVTTNNQLVAAAIDADRADDFLVLEALQSYSDVKDQTHLENLLAADLTARKPPQQVITVKPFEGIEPWTHFNVGDVGYVVAGRSLRGGFPKRPGRIMGFSVAIDDQDNEDIDVVTQEDV